MLSKIKKTFWNFKYKIQIQKQKKLLNKQIELNHRTRKYTSNIMFIPHGNSKHDNYDIINADSDNVLILFNSILKDKRFSSYSLYIGYYDEKSIEKYIEHCKPYNNERVHFFSLNDEKIPKKLFNICATIFTDEIYRTYSTKVQEQEIICLNYFGGIFKTDLHRIILNGGFNTYITEQQRAFRNYDYLISLSDLSAKLMAAEECMYFDKILSLGFPRNDIFFHDNKSLRRELENIIDVKFKYIFSYVPTHRDYDDPNREFYNSPKAKKHSIFGPISAKDLKSLEETLETNDAIIIAKIHPAQYTAAIELQYSERVIFYQDIVNKINTSLNPILAISDFLITDYTSTVYDFLFTDRPIIYYFYDYEKYKNTRGFFIDPIEPICMGEIVYDIEHLCKSIDAAVHGADPYKEKRRILSDLFIKYKDGNSAERIKQYFLLNKKEQNLS